MWIALPCVVAAALVKGPQEAHMRSSEGVIRHAVDEADEREADVLRDEDALASGALPVIPTGALELVKQELDLPPAVVSPEVRMILSSRSAASTMNECGLKKDDGEPLADRKDDRYSFVKNMDEATKKQFEKTTRNFYCLVESKKIQMDHDPVDVPGGSFNGLFGSASKSEFASQFGHGKQPSCAIVSHSGDFINMTKKTSFTSEIDAHDMVIRFNQHDISPGHHGCRTDFRFLNNQFAGDRFRHYYTAENGLFRREMNAPQKGFVFLWNDNYNCTKRKEIDEVYKVVSESTSKPVYTLHPHYEMDLDSTLLQFAEKDPILGSCLWDGNQHKDMPCYTKFNHRYAVPTKVKGSYKKATLGFYAVWTLLSQCDTLSLYGFAADAFAKGDMKAHQPSLAEQTLWKIMASRIERLTSKSGQLAYVYHLDGLQRYKASRAKDECDPQWLAALDIDSEAQTRIEAKKKFCLGAKDVESCAKTTLTSDYCGVA